MSCVILPNFVVVGAARSGTSSLARNLAAHPDAFVANGEIHFFSRDENWGRGAEWYAAHFSKAGNAVAVGEKSPSYLYDERTPDRIAEVLPDGHRCVFVAILREPVARAVSHVELRRRRGTEDRSVAAAIRENLDSCSSSGAGAGFDYIGRGRYAEQLNRYAERFGAEDLHIEFHEDLVADPSAVLSRLCGRLGLPPFDPDHEPVRVNQSARLRYPRLYRRLLQARAGEWLPQRTGRWLWKQMQEPIGYDPLPPDLHDEMRAAYGTANTELAAFLDSPLPDGWST